MIYRSGHAIWTGIEKPNANVSYDGDSSGDSVLISAKKAPS